MESKIGLVSVLHRKMRDQFFFKGALHLRYDLFYNLCIVCVSRIFQLSSLLFLVLAFKWVACPK